MADNGWLNVGRITGVHGLAGNLKIWSHAGSPETFTAGRTVRLVSEGQAAGSAHIIIRASARKKGLLLTLEGISSIEDAEALIGKEILMNREELPQLEEDTWYWEDLMGLMVEDTASGEIGVVDHLFPTGADDILVVKAGKKETLIPMNTHFVNEVDLEGGRVLVTLPEGMIPE